MSISTQKMGVSADSEAGCQGRLGSGVSVPTRKRGVRADSEAGCQGRLGSRVSGPTRKRRRGGEFAAGLGTTSDGLRVTWSDSE